MNDERDPRDTWPEQDAAQPPREPDEPDEPTHPDEPTQPDEPMEAPSDADAEHEPMPSGATPFEGGEAMQPEGGEPTSWSGEESRSEPPPGEAEAYVGAPPVAPRRDEEVTAAHTVPATAVGESTQCPRCGTENRPGIAFCRNCGQRLVAPGAAATLQRPGTPEGTQACPRCGTHNRAGTAFCQNCGANLRAPAPGYVPPAVEAAPAEAAAPAAARAVLGPIVLLIGAIGLITGWLLPFLSGGSLFDRALGSGGYGAALWNGFSTTSGALADQIYYALAAAVPLLVLLLVLLVIGGFVRARPGVLQASGLIVALLWAIGLVILFVLVELLPSTGGSLTDMLRGLSPAGIIFFLASLIVVIGTLTRFGRS